MMTGFSNMFKAELYKLAKLKSLAKILIAIIIIFVVATLLYSLIYGLVGGMEIIQQEGEITQETIDALEQEYAEYKAYYDQEKPTLQMRDTTLYNIKAQITLYKYMNENGLNFSKVGIFNSLASISANAYIEFIMSVMMLAIGVYATVSIIRSLAGERAQGTLKMQLLRPISKDAMLAAKFLAVLVVSFGLFVLTTVIAGVVGVIAYDVDSRSVLAIVNAESVVRMSPFVALLINFVYYSMELFAYISLGLFLSTTIKKNEALPIALAMIIMFIGQAIEATLGYIFVGYAGFMVNLEWINALTANGPAINHMNLYSMLGISFAWVIGMLITSIFSFRNAEIHT